MDSGNVARLTVVNTQPVHQRITKGGEVRDVEFLSLRLLNKRGRVQLSQLPLDYTLLPGKSSLLAVGNQKGYLAAAVLKEDGHYLLVSTLSELRTAIESGRADPEPFIPFTPQRTVVKVPGTPTIIKFAFNEERLVVGFLEGPILVYSTNELFLLTRMQVDPMYVFPGDASTIPRDIQPNPGESPQLVAVMRGIHGQEPGHRVDILDIQQFKHIAGWRKGNDPNIAPASISWSPKGKQIAIGLQSGDILLYSPLSPMVPKSHLLKPPFIPPTHSSLLATTWLANPTFHTVFCEPRVSSFTFDAAESPAIIKTHVISTHDSKSQSVVDVEVDDPSPPFGAMYSLGPLSVVLRNWSPTKFIIICGDGPSTDIGLIGSLPSPSEGSEDVWVNFALEETSTPSLPLGKDMMDMALLGLEIDLTSSKSVRMSEQPDDGTPDLPPSPILYAYVSDGTIVAWHVLNTSGNTYPGMVATANATEGSFSSITSITQQKASMQDFGMPSLRVSPPTSPTPGSPFHTTEASTARMNPAPTFGQMLSSPSSNIVAPAQGFGAFEGVNTTSKFGSPGFGFAAGSTPSLPDKPSAAPALGSSKFGSNDAQKSPASSPFGSTAFGQTSAAPSFGAPSFGSKPAAPAFGQSGFSALSSGTPKSAFGSSSGGFAAFASQGTSTFGVPVNSSSSSESKPAQTSIFGQSSFGQAASSSVPQSVFGAGGSGQASATPASALGSSGSGPTTPFGRPQATQPIAAFGSLGQKATTPAFGQTGFGNTADYATSQTGAYDGFGALGDSLKSSTSHVPERFGSPPGSPPSPGESPPSSPELRHTSQPMKPASLHVKPAEGFGTFVKSSGSFEAPRGATKAAASFIKPAEGFGISSQQHPVTSTLGPPKPAVSTFKPTTFGTQASTSSSTIAPTFGSTSALGRNKPAFGTSTFSAGPQQTVSEPSKPITGGFGAFSSGGGGFASFANASMSTTFDDILSSGEPDKPKSSETPLVFGNLSTSKPANVPGFGTPTERKVSPVPAAGKPTNVPSTQSSGIGRLDLDEDGSADKRQLPKDAELLEHPSIPHSNIGDSSFSLLSLSEATPQAGSASTPQTPATTPSRTGTVTVPGEREDETNGPEDVEESVSEPFSLTDDGLDEPASEGVEQPSRSPTRSLSEDEPDEPENIPLPETPTPRSTPTPTPTQSPLTLPAVDISSPPPPSPSPPVLSANKIDVSTTPPGSPEKTTAPAPAPLAPKPTIPSSTVSPFGLGLGRPSSRPIRSSPLASAPITSTDDEDSAPDITPSKSAPAIVDVRAAGPKTPFGQSSPIPISSTELPAGSGDGPSSSAARRPKTPPFLGAPLTPGVRTAPLRNPFALGQPQVSPVPLKASVPPPAATPVTQLVAPANQGREPEELPKHPMQVEFQRAYQEMTNELVQLYKKAQEMALIRPIISEPRGLDKLVLNNQDFVPGKYSLGDLKYFTTMIGTLQKKVVPLLEQGDADKSLLQDLQNLALISETKQEELSRWVRAQEDPEFAKTLKPRALGPEHSENQIRLRKALQAAHDRVQQCEDEMESLKKRLEQHKSGKMSLRPPSLDTIDRTCRNIQLALEERTKLLEQLNDHIDALSPQGSQRLRSSCGHTGASASNAGSVTPPFASVAAAALNSERSSLKLKNALLSARKEPLLTTHVTKLETSRKDASGAPVSPQTQRPEWKLPPVPPLSSPSSSVNRRTGRPVKRHGAVQLKAGPPGSDPKPVAFDWGPLPGVAPMDKLSLDVRSHKGKGLASSSRQEVEDDGEWEEAAEDYQQHH